MQGQRRTIGSFPAIVSMIQGPSSNGTDMNHQSSMNRVQNAVEFRLSDYRGSSGETVCLRSTSPNMSFSGWNTGEASSALNLINQVNDGGPKLEHELSSSCSATAEDGPRPEERLRLGNQSRIRPSFLSGSSSNHTTQSMNLDIGHIANSADRGKGKETGSSVNSYNPSALDRDKTSSGSALHNHKGTSSASSGYMAWGDSTNSSSSLVNWAPSCKRKTLEGSSMQLCTRGSSSSPVQSENGYWPAIPVDLNASSSLSDASPLEDFPAASLPLQQNARNEVIQEAANAFPMMIGVVENVERPLRNFDRRLTHHQHHESIPLNLPSTGSARHHIDSSPHQIPCSFLCNDSLELRLTAGVTATNSGAPRNWSPAQHMNTFPWDRAANPRASRASTSYNSGERAVREDFNLRIFPRDGTEHPMNVNASSGHEPMGWHTSSNNVNNAGGIPHTSWTGSSSNVHSLPNPSWNLSFEVPTENPQRVSEFSPWSFAPSVSSISGTHNSQSPSTSGPPSFSQGSSNNQPHPRSAYLMERRGGNVLSASHSLRALAFDNDGRRRLISEIRQVLIAMRRGENLRAEDMLFDPFVYHSIAEMHDRHREMRLDVDNMSYEELLALEERIGDVSTGLSEDIILKLLKQQIYMSVMTESSSDLEPCCICQEEFADGENVGSLDCGHEFHSNCIKQWLMQKNLCPICKTTALGT